MNNLSSEESYKCRRVRGVKITHETLSVICDCEKNSHFHIVACSMQWTIVKSAVMRQQHQQTIAKDNQRFLSVNYKRERTIMDWNRKVHSSPIKVYRRFSEHESKPKSEVSAAMCINDVEKIATSRNYFYSRHTYIWAQNPILKIN